MFRFIYVTAQQCNQWYEAGWESKYSICHFYLNKIQVETHGDMCLTILTNILQDRYIATGYSSVTFIYQYKKHLDLFPHFINPAVFCSNKLHRNEQIFFDTRLKRENRCIIIPVAPSTNCTLIRDLSSSRHCRYK